MPAKTLSESCDACQSAGAQATSRNRRLCSKCFQHFVGSKVMKRMETYRFKNNTDGRRRKLLLPLSGGVSSQTLLHILDGQLQRQVTTQSRTAYDIVLIHVETSVTENKRTPQWFTSTREYYSHHVCLPIISLAEVSGVDAEFEEDMNRLGFIRQDNESVSDLVERFLHSARTATASEDILDALKQRLIHACAQEHGCEAILWSHSDSRLAARALAAVAKGRGVSLCFDITDGPTPSGLNSIYPLRGLFKEELELYMSLQREEVQDLVVQSIPNPTNNIRDTSIEQLLTTFITTQGEKYPNITANVVRTVGKLETSAHNRDHSLCSLCRAPMLRGVSVSGPDISLCYSCKRTTKEMHRQPL